MMRRSSRMLPLIGCSALLCFLFSITQADDIGTPIDSHGLQEVHHLSTLPPELAKALGWQGRDRDKIADLDREPGAPTPKSASRWFLLGGLSKTYALIVIDEGSAEHIHANSYSLTGNEWVSTDEWILNSRPYSVGELARMLQSPQTQALTARWHKLQRDRDLQRRIATLDPNRYRSPTSLRDMDINDEEVLQIEAVSWRGTLAGCNVMVHQHLDGTITLTYGPHRLGRYTAAGRLIPSRKTTTTRSMEKTAASLPWKSLRDSHFSTLPAAGGSLNQNRTDHVLQKADIFTC